MYTLPNCFVVSIEDGPDGDPSTIQGLTDREDIADLEVQGDVAGLRDGATLVAMRIKTEL